jgi:predicted nucleic acid-binding protein
VIVIDASAMVLVLVDEREAGHRARARLAGEAITAPELLDLEVLSVLRRLTAGGILTARRARAALDDLAVAPIQRVPHLPLLERCWALRPNATFYDAAYIAVAELLELTLVTADRQLATTPGVRCAIDVLA